MDPRNQWQCTGTSVCVHVCTFKTSAKSSFASRLPVDYPIRFDGKCPRATAYKVENRINGSLELVTIPLSMRKGLAKKKYTRKYNVRMAGRVVKMMHHRYFQLVPNPTPTSSCLITITDGQSMGFTKTRGFKASTLRHLGRIRDKNITINAASIKQ